MSCRASLWPWAQGTCSHGWLVLVPHWLALKPTQHSVRAGHLAPCKAHTGPGTKLVLQGTWQQTPGAPALLLLQMGEWVTGPIREGALSYCVLTEASGCLADAGAGDKVWRGAGGGCLSLLCSVTSHQAREAGLCALPSLVPPSPSLSPRRHRPSFLLAAPLCPLPPSLSTGGSPA